jgi:hypothetical protein
MTTAPPKRVEAGATCPGEVRKNPLLSFFGTF